MVNVAIVSERDALMSQRIDRNTTPKRIGYGGKILEKLSNPLRTKSGRLIFSKIMKPTVLRKFSGN